MNFKADCISVIESTIFHLKKKLNGICPQKLKNIDTLDLENFMDKFKNLNDEYGSVVGYRINRDETETYDPNIDYLYNALGHKIENLEEEIRYDEWDLGGTYDRERELVLRNAILFNSREVCVLEEYRTLLRQLPYIGLFLINKNNFEELNQTGWALDLSINSIYIIHISYQLHKVMHKYGYISDSLYQDVKRGVRYWKKLATSRIRDMNDLTRDVCSESTLDSDAYKHIIVDYWF